MKVQVNGDYIDAVDDAVFFLESLRALLHALGENELTKNNESVASALTYLSICCYEQTERIKEHKEG